MDSFTGQQLISAAKENGFTHFAISCVDEYPNNMGVVDSLIKAGALELIYSDSCSTLYSINYG